MKEDMLKLRWNEYCAKRCTCALYFFDDKKNTLIIFQEGDGSNLLDEDEEAGCVDYWYASVYDKENGEIGGGMQLLTEYIQEENKTLGELIDNFEENSALFDEVPCELKDLLINPEEGKQLAEIFMEIDEGKFKARLGAQRLEMFLEGKEV